MVSIRVPRIGLPEARAMVRWKRTSWMRYSCGSSRAAYISVTSSASSAMCSSVARSAARATTLDSRTRRASNICQGRKPWRAPRTERELESSAGGPLETKVPAPWRLLRTPMAERKPVPARGGGARGGRGGEGGPGPGVFLGPAGGGEKAEPGGGGGAADLELAGEVSLG